MYACQIRYVWGWSTDRRCDLPQFARQWHERQSRHYPASDLRILRNGEPVPPSDCVALPDPFTPAAIAERSYAYMQE